MTRTGPVLPQAQLEDTYEDNCQLVVSLYRLNANNHGHEHNNNYLGINNAVNGKPWSRSQAFPFDSVEEEGEADDKEIFKNSQSDKKPKDQGQPPFLFSAAQQPQQHTLTTPPNQPFTMPSTPPRRLVPKDRFAYVFGTLKTQTYHDPAARGPGSHNIRTLAWNTTGQLIATGSTDRTLRIWNPERANVKYSTELRGHSAGIEKVLFNPVRDSELASCSSDGTVRFWDVRSKTCVSRLDVGGEAFTMTWSADGSVVVVGRMDDTLIPISIESPSTPSILTNGTTSPNIADASAIAYTNLEPHPQPVQTNATAFSDHVPTPSAPELHLLVTTGDGTVKMLSYPSFNLLHTLHAHASACLSLALSPANRYLAIGGSDALISLWDTTDWICRRTVSSGNGGAVRGVSWSFDGRFLCGACDELGCGGGGLEIFHAETGENVYTVPTGGGSGVGIPAVAWHPSRYWLAYSITADGPTGNPGLKIVGAAGGGL